MDLFVTTFESVAVLIGIGLIGFYIIKKGIVPGKVLSIISPLALEIALPSLIFARILTTFTPEEFPDWWQLPLWWIFFTLISFSLMLVFRYLSNKKTRNEFSISLFYQNAIFFPLAIITGMFGEGRIENYQVYLFFFTLFYPPLFFGTYHFFFKTKEKIKINWKKIIHPVLLATIIAIIIASLGFEISDDNFIVRIFSLLGAMTIPLLFLILGGNIYNDFKKKGKLKIFEITKFVVIKNFIYPFIFLLIVIYLKDYIASYIALIIVLQASVPPVTAVPIVTERAGGNRSIVNQFIVASFITSLISIPLVIFVFSNYFTI